MTPLVVDTSAVLAVAFAEATAGWVLHTIESADAVSMSTVNLTQTLIHFYDRQPTLATEFEAALLTSGIAFIPPDTAQARLAAQARLRLPLNLGDCFAYALAKTLNATLLTLDRDFRHTDLPVLLPEADQSRE